MAASPGQHRLRIVRGRTGRDRHRQHGRVVRSDSHGDHVLGIFIVLGRAAKVRRSRSKSKNIIPTV